MKKLVLAYSWGLDTSYCAVHCSKDLGYEVHAVSVNTGGFTELDINDIEGKAYKMGVKTYRNIDAVDNYYQKVVKYLIYGNVLKNNTYPLSVSSERIIQAIQIIKYAKKINASKIAIKKTLSNSLMILEYNSIIYQFNTYLRVRVFNFSFENANIKIEIKLSNIPCPKKI